MINSLKYAKQLEEAGVPRAQAELHLQIVSEIMETSLATKQDLNNLSTEMRHGFSQLSKDIAIVKHEMTIRIGTIATIAIGTIAALVKLLQ